MYFTSGLSYVSVLLCIAYDDEKIQYDVSDILVSKFRQAQLHHVQQRRALIRLHSVAHDGTDLNTEISTNYSTNSRNSTGFKMKQAVETSDRSWMP